MNLLFIFVLVFVQTYGEWCYVDPNNINLTLYNNAFANGTSSFDATNLVVDQLVFLLIHGWSENSTHRWYPEARTALLNKYPNSNVIVGDYGKYSMDPIYVAAWCAAPNVGLALSTKIDILGIPINELILIGFSIGAQIAGDIARDVTKRNKNNVIPLVIALDAAGIGYDPLKSIPIFGSHTYLKSGDANQVVGIYSSRESLGMKTLFADINVFIDNGNDHDCPSIGECVLSDPIKPCIFCAHTFAREIFLRAIPMAPEYIARLCTNFNSYESCSGNTKYVIQAIETTAATNKDDTYFIKVDGSYQQIA